MQPVEEMPTKSGTTTKIRKRRSMMMRKKRKMKRRTMKRKMRKTKKLMRISRNQLEELVVLF